MQFYHFIDCSDKCFLSVLDCVKEDGGVGDINSKFPGW